MQEATVEHDPRARARALGLGLAIVVAVLFLGPIALFVWLEVGAR